ncbi:MAG: hypothetical protein J7493_08390 [Porphyrobacter sp.]|nr:hypothetical protein [Porphyrobacter sp.]
MNNEREGIPWPKWRGTRDFGIAVHDAKRLNDCWAELSEALSQRPSLEGDEALWITRAGATDNELWVHEMNSRDVATALMQRAIADRTFSIWLRLADSEVQADPQGLASMSHKTLKTGVYESEELPHSDLEGRPLWVKKFEWRRYLDETLARRYGEHTGMSAAQANSADDEPIGWDDFGEENLPALKRILTMAVDDEWWSWPEAIAWVGSRDPRTIASLRFWAQWWAGRGDDEATITLGAQHNIACKHCSSASQAEAELVAAISRGAVRTCGRASLHAKSAPLAKDDWRGGAVIYSQGVAVLGPASDNLVAWAFDIAVGRDDLMRAFPVSETTKPEGTAAAVNADAQTKSKPERKRPGRAADPYWPLAIATVTQECLKAGYKRPLKRGQKAAIQTMLLNEMAVKDKHFSEDSAAKYAMKVIAALPDN